MTSWLENKLIKKDYSKALSTRDSLSGCILLEIPTLASSKIPNSNKALIVSVPPNSIFFSPTVA